MIQLKTEAYFYIKKNVVKLILISFNNVFFIKSGLILNAKLKIILILFGIVLCVETVSRSTGKTGCSFHHAQNEFIRHSLYLFFYSTANERTKAPHNGDWEWLTRNKYLRTSDKSEKSPKKNETGKIDSAKTQLSSYNNINEPPQNGRVRSHSTHTRFISITFVGKADEIVVLCFSEARKIHRFGKHWPEMCHIFRVRVIDIMFEWWLKRGYVTGIFEIA